MISERFQKKKQTEKEETKTKTLSIKKPNKKPLLLFNTSLLLLDPFLKEFNSFTSAVVADARETCLSGRGSACSLF